MDSEAFIEDAVNEADALEAGDRYCIFRDGRELVMRSVRPGEDAPFRLNRDDVMALLGGHLALGYCVRLGA